MVECVEGDSAAKKNQHADHVRPNNPKEYFLGTFSQSCKIYRINKRSIPMTNELQLNHQTSWL